LFQKNKDIFICNSRDIEVIEVLLLFPTEEEDFFEGLENKNLN
jgi:hypothetical protein